MNKSNVDLLIFIKGQTPAIEYRSPRDFQTYIEGRDGSEFEIEVRNHNPFRIEAVISVDGLSVLNGKEAGDESEGYVVPANGRGRIPGWKLNGASAAKFVFAGRRGGSYAEQSTGNSSNKGVIGMMVFQERAVYHPHVNAGYFGYPAGMRGATLNNMAVGSAHTYSSSATLSASNAASSASLSSTNAQTFASQASGSPDSARAHATSASAAAQSALDAYVKSAEVKQTLGTGFGEKTEFATTMVQFNRADMIALVALYYDDRRGLEKRGIELVRPNQTRYATAPNPFPKRDDGCVPPAGWNG